MRLLSIDQCRSGMRLGKNLYSEEGTVLLSTHAELTDRLLSRLRHHGIDRLYIEDSRTDDIDIPDVINDQTRARAMKTIRTTFRDMMENSQRKRAVHYHSLGKDFRGLMNMIVDDLSGHENAMIMLNDIQITDLYLYRHSLNVCIYTTILGMAHGYSRDELMAIGLGALLHDIGKTQIPLDILRKPDKLTAEEFATMKKHTEYGFKMLKDEPNIPLLSAHCAFQHHERIDGSGYPRGIRGDEIHEYARWIGLVDSYDAMTTHRVYRNAMLPQEALEILFTGADTQYDKKKIELFRDKIAIYPLGSDIKLNTGERGVVVDLNSAMPQRPIVRLLQDAEGNDLTQPYEIDLSKKLNFVIEAAGEIKPEQL